MRNFYCLLFVLSVVISAKAQTLNRPPDRMKMLSAFNGEWKGELAEIVKGKKVKTKVMHTSMKVAGGWGVQVSETATMPDKSKLLSVRMFSYSNSGDTTYMYVVDNRGNTFFYTGSWKGSKHLDLRCSTNDVAGKVVKKEITYDFKNMREYDYKYISMVADSVDTVIEMNMKKE